MPVTRHELSPLVAGARARRFMLSLTDACYAELADTADLALLITDRRLVRAWPEAEAIG